MDQNSLEGLNKEELIQKYSDLQSSNDKLRTNFQKVCYFHYVLIIKAQNEIIGHI